MVYYINTSVCQIIFSGIENFYWNAPQTGWSFVCFTQDWMYQISLCNFIFIYLEFIKQSCMEALVMKQTTLYMIKQKLSLWSSIEAILPCVKFMLISYELHFTRISHDAQLAVYIGIEHSLLKIIYVFLIVSTFLIYKVIFIQGMSVLYLNVITNDEILWPEE